ncbi:MAG: transcription antitermination factor NusB [Pseudomonadota bacterium]
MPDKKRKPGLGRSLARQRALQALYQWYVTGRPLESIEPEFTSQDVWETLEMKQVDLKHFKRLIHETSNLAVELDEKFVDLLDRPINQLDPIELIILRIGAYEMLYCPNVPWRVAINESVELARLFGAEQSHKYVNGILDKLAKSMDIQHKP